MPDEEVLELAEYEPSEPSTNGHNGNGNVNIMRIAERVDREWTEVSHDEGALLREFLGTGQEFLDILLRTRFRNEDQLNRHVRTYARDWYRLKRSGALKGHRLEKFSLRSVVMQLKEYGLISMYGDGRYEALQGLAGVVVAERNREGRYKRKDKEVSKE